MSFFDISLRVNNTPQSEGKSSSNTIDVSGSSSRYGVIIAYGHLNASSWAFRGLQTSSSRLLSRTVACLPSVPALPQDLNNRIDAAYSDPVLGVPVQSALERAPVGMPPLGFPSPSLDSSIWRNDEVTSPQLLQISDASSSSENKQLSCDPIVSVMQPSAVAASLLVSEESASVVPQDRSEECRLYKLRRPKEESFRSSLREGSFSSSSQVEPSLGQDEMDYDIIRDFENGEVLVSKPVIP